MQHSFSYFTGIFKKTSIKSIQIFREANHVKKVVMMRLMAKTKRFNVGASLSYYIISDFQSFFTWQTNERSLLNLPPTHWLRLLWNGEVLQRIERECDQTHDLHQHVIASPLFQSLTQSLNIRGLFRTLLKI